MYFVTQIEKGSGIQILHCHNRLYICIIKYTLPAITHFSLGTASRPSVILPSDQTLHRICK